MYMCKSYMLYLNMYNLYCVLLPELCHQVDKLQMTDCFRNGDFVRAQAGEANSWTNGADINRSMEAEPMGMVIRTHAVPVFIIVVLVVLSMYEDNYE